MPEREDLYGSDDVIRTLLHDTETWIIVGLSSNRMRPAYSVAAFLQRHGKRIVPVHPRGEEVLGEPGYTSVTEAAAAVGQVDVVDLFVNSTRAGEIVREAIAFKPKGIWLQLEVVDEDAAQEAVDADIDMVMDRCPAIEWPRLGPAA
jgi:predicted CoA-binding protein